MAKIIGLPKLSPTMEEGTLVAWAKSEGDRVEVDDLLAEVETDKATMEFRSFDRGVLLKILVETGETLAPDAPVAIIGEEGDDIAPLLEQVKNAGGGNKASGSSASEASASSKESDEKSGASEEKPEPSESKDSSSRGVSAEPVDTQPSGVASSGRVPASPLVRRIARERGIELTDVPGSGPHGRVIKRDIDAYEPAAESRTESEGAERRPPREEKASSTRKTIARRLGESKREIPHYYLTIDVDADALVAARAAINAALDGETKISFNDIVIKAAAQALREVPECNASWGGDVIRYHQVVDISVAVAIPDGLITPVVRDADRKGLRAISTEVRELAERAKSKKLRAEEIQNGTFSISNLGMYGIDEFAAVINPPEGAILAVGGIRDEPVVRDGAVVPGRRMKMTLSADHRVIDGAVGAKFLAALRRYLETPVSMLI